MRLITCMLHLPYDSSIQDCIHKMLHQSLSRMCPKCSLCSMTTGREPSRRKPFKSAHVGCARPPPIAPPQHLLSAPYPVPTAGYPLSQARHAQVWAPMKGMTTKEAHLTHYPKGVSPFVSDAEPLAKPQEPKLKPTSKSAHGGGMIQAKPTPLDSGPKVLPVPDSPSACRLELTPGPPRAAGAYTSNVETATAVTESWTS
jgi:hypothetical protein